MSSEGARHLAAVWVADVAGYITLSGRDEEAAFATVAELQRVAKGIVEQHGGLVLSFIGDSAIATFASTAIAVRSALELQDAFQASDIVRRHGSGLRVGVHVGEIVETADGEVHGDGVNVASRLQAVAETGGVVASESAARQIENRDDFVLRSLGSHELKGVKRPMEVYAVRLALSDEGEPEAEDTEATALAKSLSDRYRIGHEIGRGGMATVYKAHDIRHDRPVALKVMHRELTDAIGAERFLREIRVTANLQHPHVLPLFDSGEVGGRLFYVMPMVDGESLKDRLRRETQLGITDTIKIVRDVTSALAHAHAKGVVHRDIKPENILFSGDYAVLADFGVARAVTQAAEEGLTRRGLAMGSPPYMAPEQMKDSGTIDGRTDIYALGCVMYEMLVGSPPFTGSTAQVVMARHATDPVPPIRSVRSTVPEELEAVVMRCLAKVQADRFADANAMVAALDAVSRSHAASPSATPQGVAPPSPTTHGAETATAATTQSVAQPTSATTPRPVPTDPTSATGQRVASGSYDTNEHSGEHSFLGELKRRKVYQAGAIYLFLAMGALQAAELAFPTFGLEAYFDFVVMGSMLGFPLVLVLAWAYDLTTKGLRRTDPYGTLGTGVPTVARHGVRLRVAGVLGLLLFVGVFPLHRTATIPNVDLDRRAARAVAEDLLETMGWGGAFTEAVTFRHYPDLNAFMQEVEGLDWARGPMGERIAEWDWRLRWFRPGEPEEWQVAIGPSERLIFFQHVIPQNEEGANLTEDEARVIAEQFLVAQAIDRSDLVELGTSSNTFENRTRHQFNWRIPELDIEWASPNGEVERGVGHVHVRVDGDRVSMYQNHFQEPEGFGRARSSRRAIFSVILGAVIFFVFGASVWTLVSIARREPGTVRWKRALVSGAAIGLVGALALMSYSWTDRVMGADSAAPPFATWAIMGFMGAFFFVLMGGASFLLIAVSEALARRYYPQSLESWDELCAGDWRSPVVSGDIMHGVFFAGVLLGIGGLSSLAVASLPGTSGITPPEGVENLDVPLTPLTIAFMGLVDELTILLALFAAIVILRRYLKSSAVAIGVVMVVGAMATPLPASPVYLGASFRAVRVAVLALALIRWGPIMTTTAIFVAACIGQGVSLAFAGNSTSTTHGVILVGIGLVPLIVALVSRAATEEEPALPAPT